MAEAAGVPEADAALQGLCISRAGPGPVTATEAEGLCAGGGMQRSPQGSGSGDNGSDGRRQGGSGGSCAQEGGALLGAGPAQEGGRARQGPLPGLEPLYLCGDSHCLSGLPRLSPCLPAPPCVFGCCLPSSVSHAS